MNRLRFMHVSVLLAGAVCLGCGAKTGLFTDAAGNGPPDASLPPPPVDAGRDGPAPAPICVEVPYEARPQSLELSFEPRVRSAEVLVLVDVTQSMEAVVEELEGTLRERILPEMRRTIPALRLSVAWFEDFPVVPYGGRSDRPFELVQRSTSDVDTIERAIDVLVEEAGGGGADTPESQVEALYQAATGEGIGRFVEPATCPSDTVGYPCFSNGAARIVLLFSNGWFHNGPDPSKAYDPGTIDPAPASYEQTVAALDGIGARVIGLFSGFEATGGLQCMRQLARDTGTVTRDGEPLVFDIGLYGDRLDEGLAATVSTLVDEVPLDVELSLEDVGGDAIDATRLVRDVKALPPEPPSGARRHDDWYEELQPGTRVSLRIRLDNDIVPPTAMAQRFPLRVVLVGDGVIRLEERVVDIVIPGVSEGGCD